MNKSEFKSAAKQTLTAVYSSIVGSLIEYGRLEVSIGMQLSIMRETFVAAKSAEVDLSQLNVGGASVGTDDWREYARTLVPGRSAPTLYRWMNAGTVARIIGDSVGNAPVGALVPLYRILTDAKSDEESAAAADLVREVWADVLKQTPKGKTPSEDVVLALAEAASPTTRGASSSSGGTDDAKTDDETKTDDENRAPSENVVSVDPVAVESAAGPISSMLKQWETDGTPRETAVGIMLATIRLVNEHGRDVVAAVLATGAAAPTAETAAVPAESK